MQNPCYTGINNTNIQTHAVDWERQHWHLLQDGENSTNRLFEGRKK